MKKTTIAVAIMAVLIGTAATANKVRTARHGPQLPNQVLVQAWNQDDATLVRNMRDYVRSLSRK